MLAEIGLISIWLSFAGCLTAVGLALVNAFTQEKRWAVGARNLLIAVFALLTIACLTLVWAQWTGEYSINYVRTVTSDVQPDALKITALWGSQSGSLLFYGWMLSLFMVLALLFNWGNQQRIMGWTMVFAGGTLAFFLMLTTFFENPFERAWIDPDSSEWVTITDESGERVVVLQSATDGRLQPEGLEVGYPWRVKQIVEFGGEQTVVNAIYPFYTTSPDIPPQEPLYNESLQCGEAAPLQDGSILRIVCEYDGQGLNPLLRHPGMVIHPPMLYLGFTGFLLPFAFAMAAMIINQKDISWMWAVRRWSLIAWLFLSIGLVLGGRWAYDVLGWGGYWGWDPVENSALLPWLTGTAFLHSVMIQEKRGMLKGWNMIMIITTYLLVLLGTVATRTGLLSSVHTFAKSPLAIPMGGFLGGTLVISALVYLWRGNQGYFKGDHEIEGILSRESMFMLNNWVFFALTIVVFWGTWAEKITDLMVGIGLRDTIINLGPEYYEMPVAVLFLILYILMGVAPLVAWRRATAKHLGTSLRTPIALTLIVMISLLIYGIDFWATFGFSIASFAGIATLVEIYKGAEARHRAHKESWGVATYRLIRRNHRRYGGYMIHLGVVVIGIGVIGSTLFQDVTQVTLNPGDSVEHAGYTMRYDQGALAEADDGRSMYLTEVSLWKDGEFIEQLRPRRDEFPNDPTQMLIAGSHSTIGGDFYVRINFIPTTVDRQPTNPITFAIYYNPLIGFVWWGGTLMILGTFIATYPEPASKRARVKKRAFASAPAPAGD